MKCLNFSELVLFRRFCPEGPAIGSKVPKIAFSKVLEKAFYVEKLEMQFSEYKSVLKVSKISN